MQNTKQLKHIFAGMIVRAVAGSAVLAIAITAALLFTTIFAKQ